MNDGNLHLPPAANTLPDLQRGTPADLNDATTTVGALPLEDAVPQATRASAATFPVDASTREAMAALNAAARGAPRVVMPVLGAAAPQVSAARPTATASTAPVDDLAALADAPDEATALAKGERVAKLIAAVPQDQRTDSAERDFSIFVQHVDLLRYAKRVGNLGESVVFARQLIFSWPAVLAALRALTASSAAGSTPVIPAPVTVPAPPV